MWVGAPRYMCVGQRTACGIWFPFTMWVLLGIKLRAQRLGTTTFTHSHFTSSSELYIKKGCKNVFCAWVDLCLGLTIAGYNLQHLFLGACYFQGRQKRGWARISMGFNSFHPPVFLSSPFLIFPFALM